MLAPGTEKWWGHGSTGPTGSYAYVMTPATSASDPAEQFKKAWGRIKPDLLENLMAGMPQRVHGCIAMKGSRSGK